MRFIRRVEFFVPVRTVSELNQRDHWTVRLKRKKAQQKEVLAAAHNALYRKKVQFPCVVTFTRIANRRLDSDNLASAFKFCRDALAYKLGVNDGDDNVTWVYDQRTVRERTYGVKIQIEERR